MSDCEIAIKKEKKKLKIKKEYILVALLLAVVLFIFMQNFNFDAFNFNFEKETTMSYKTEVENSLVKILESVNGVGKVNVFVTVDGTAEEVVLKNVETKTENNIKTSIETAVLVNGKPYIIKSLNPNIIGVIVVCEGADNLQVKMAITEILVTSLKVNTESVRIIKMK